ncbi:MAG: GLUG motif-containing protein [Rikenellaceae bacterium]
MMKKFLRNFALMAAAAVGVVSCEATFEDADDIFATDETAVTATLYASTPSQTKVSFAENGDAGIDLTWEEGDEFALYDGTDKVATFTCTDADNGKFESADALLTNGKAYTAKYNDAADLSTQNGDKISQLDEACQMEATFTYGEDETIEFSHTMAVMTFSFESTTTPAKLVFANGAETYTVNYSAIEPVNGYYTSHIMINPCEGEKRTLTFSLYEADEADAYDIRTVETSKAYAAGYRYTSPVSSLDATFWVGSGTESDPYQISTLGHLRLLTANVADGTTYSGKYFELMNDIDLEGSSDNPWSPIGTGEYNTTAFAGVFDGGGYSVTGLYIEASTTYQGLFGSVVEGTIKNLSVGGSVTVTSVGTCGVVIGYCKYATIISCTALEGSSVVGSSNNVAGISGYAYSTTFTDCHNHASVSGTRYIGGIVGYCNDSTVASFTNCSNTGAIYSSSNNFVGGIAGKIFGSSSVVHTMTNCFNSGSVSSNGQYVGGLVGANQGGVIYNSYNLGEVSSTSDNVGGLVGIHESYTLDDVTTYAAVENCYTTAKVSGGSNVGLAVGKCDGATITNCYYDNSQSGEAIGLNNDNQSVLGYSTSQMQSSAIVAKLNAIASKLNYTNVSACVWKDVSNSYPTLDYGNVSTLTEVTATIFGSGTESDPYLILFDAQLRDLSSCVSAGETYSGKYFEMMNDIDLGGSLNEFVTIGDGTNGYYFCGIFDGCDYEVSGLYISKSTTNYQGLFSYISNATIKNLGVSGIVMGYSYVGGIVGYAKGSTLSNCYSKVTVTGYQYSAGGVAGSSNSSKVSNSYNTGLVKGSADNVGGVVGSCTSSTVSGCYNSGSVEERKDVCDIINVGGIVGYNHSSTVSDCYNNGSVKGYEHVGGIVGICYSSSSTSSLVTFCYNTGSIEGGTYVGGVLGYNVGSTIATSVVNNSYNTGSVKGSGSYIGGVVGRNTAAVSDCIYDSSVYTGTAIGDSSGTDTNNTGSATLKATMTNGSFASVLGTDNWKEDNSTQINSGYPILIWQ